MNKTYAGKLLLTFVLLGGALMSFVLDWQANHLLNPIWHPHARYHSAILLFLYAGVASVATWMLWRRSLEQDVAFTASSLISLAYWTPYFYVPYLLPSASYWAGIPGHEPRMAGIIVYPNLIVVMIFILLTGIAWWLGRGRTVSSAA